MKTVIKTVMMPQSKNESATMNDVVNDNRIEHSIVNCIFECVEIQIKNLKYMSYIKVYVHYVWSTKNRFPFLNDSIRSQLFAHIRENAKTKNIYIDFINGYTDHVHVLVSLNDDLSIGRIAQLIKGESSHWINQLQLTTSKFEWQDEYLAIGVGDDKLNIVRNYIARQVEHHSKVTFEEEYNKFIERYGFEIVKKSI